MPNSPSTFVAYAASRVRRLRKRLGWTQAELAERCRWSDRHIQRIEAGLVDLPLTAIVRLTSRLGVPPASLLKPTKLSGRRRGRPEKKLPLRSRDR